MSSVRLDLYPNPSISFMGHIFCGDCANELNVGFARFDGYIHPQYSSDWESPWHEFHNLKFLYPDLIKAIHDQDFEAVCPCCGNNDKTLLTPLCYGMFDLELIKKSLDCDNVYFCVHCEGTFASHRHVISTSQGYVCGDCAGAALEM